MYNRRESSRICARAWCAKLRGKSKMSAQNTRKFHENSPASRAKSIPLAREQLNSMRDQYLMFARKYKIVLKFARIPEYRQGWHVMQDRKFVLTFNDQLLIFKEGFISFSWVRLLL